jgi:hypothetical protein
MVGVCGFVERLVQWGLNLTTQKCPFNAGLVRLVKLVRFWTQTLFIHSLSACFYYCL